LAENPYGYRFEVSLFQTLMQGEKAETSIIAALDAIFEKIEKYDAVAIIRGGGGQVDLSCFDSYLLASHIAQFPIPVLSGIGHERDDSVVDMVAHTRLKTPTAVAAFVIDRANMFEEHVTECLQTVVDYCSEVSIGERERLRSITQALPLIAKDIISYQKQKVRNEMLQVFNLSAQKISLQKTKLTNLHHTLTAEAHKQLFVAGNQLEGLMMNGKRVSTDILSKSEDLLERYLQVVQWVNPENVLKRGYSITRIQGKIVNSEKELGRDDVVETTLAQGKFRSKVL
jgi:exodeoxyribonuclease VII large subunit